MSEDKNVGAAYLSALTVKVGEWAKRNFDTSNPVDPALGLMEEVGELFRMEQISPIGQAVAKMHHHVLKSKQGIRGNEHEERFGFEADMIGEMVDVIDLWNDEEYGKEAFYTRGSTETPRHKREERDMTPEEIDAEKQDACGDIIVYLCDYCYRNNYDLGKIVHKTWAKVEQRDWKKNPNNAAEVAGD